MNGRALSLTANTEGEKDGRAGRNAILQRSLFKSTLSIQYIFYITWLTSLQFSDSSRLKFCSLIDNLLIPNFLKISKFKILVQHFMLFHPWIFPLASSKLCHRGWKRKRKEKASNPIANENETIKETRCTKYRHVHGIGGLGGSMSCASFSLTHFIWSDTAFYRFRDWRGAFEDLRTRFNFW